MSDKQEVDKPQSNSNATLCQVGDNPYELGYLFFLETKLICLAFDTRKPGDANEASKVVTLLVKRESSGGDPLFARFVLGMLDDYSAKKKVILPSNVDANVIDIIAHVVSGDNRELLAIAYDRIAYNSLKENEQEGAYSI